MDPQESPPEGRSFTGTVRAIVERLRGLSKVRDLDEMRALARDKGTLATRYAEVYANADALHRSAERLRFDLLLQLKELPKIWPELRQALEPFYVLKSPDWTRMELPFGMLDEDRARQLKDEVDQLLFLWVKAVVESLSQVRRRRPEQLRAESPGAPPDIVAFTLEACDRALVFSRSKAPWRALRDRLARMRGDDDAIRAGGPAGAPPTKASPAKSSRSPRPWPPSSGRTCTTRTARWSERSIAWMRHAVRLREDDYWFQFSLGYLEGLAGHPDEALEHYSIAAALQPDSPWVRYSRARLYRSKGKWRQNAFDDLDVAPARAAADRPEARRVFLERGVLYQMMGDFARRPRASTTA